MLLVGITIDPAPMRERAGAIVLLAVATAGAMLALALVAGPLLVDAGGWKPAGVAQSAFVLALAAALGANGLPIVARILEDRAMAHSAVGSIVIVAATGATALALIAAAVAIGGGDAPAGGRVALRVGAGLVLLALVLAVARARWLRLGPAVTVGAVVVLAGAAALAGDQLLSSLLVGPLIVGVAVSKGGGTGSRARAPPRRRGAARRPAGVPRPRGAAHRSARAALRRARRRAGPARGRDRDQGRRRLRGGADGRVSTPPTRARSAPSCNAAAS